MTPLSVHDEISDSHLWLKSQPAVTNAFKGDTTFSSEVSLTNYTVEKILNSL